MGLALSVFTEKSKESLTQRIIHKIHISHGFGEFGPELGNSSLNAHLMYILHLHDGTWRVGRVFPLAGVEPSFNFQHRLI